MAVGERRCPDSYQLSDRAFDSKTTAVDLGLNTLDDDAFSSVGR